MNTFTRETQDMPQEPLVKWKRLKSNKHSSAVFPKVGGTAPWGL